MVKREEGDDWDLLVLEYELDGKVWAMGILPLPRTRVVWTKPYPLELGHERTRTSGD
jgi:hypothetical protein